MQNKVSRITRLNRACAAEQSGHGQNPEKRLDACFQGSRAVQARLIPTGVKTIVFAACIRAIRDSLSTIRHPKPTSDSRTASKTTLQTATGWALDLKITLRHLRIRRQGSRTPRPQNDENYACWKSETVTRSCFNSVVYLPRLARSS